MFDCFGRVLCKECLSVMETSPIEERSACGQMLVIFRCRNPQCGRRQAYEIPAGPERRVA
jgi:hypothetical protein